MVTSWLVCLSTELVSTIFKILIDRVLYVSAYYIIIVQCVIYFNTRITYYLLYTVIL